MWRTQVNAWNAANRERRREGDRARIAADPERFRAKYRRDAKRARTERREKWQDWRYRESMRRVLKGMPEDVREMRLVLLAFNSLQQTGVMRDPTTGVRI